MITNVDLVVECMIREFLSETTPAIGLLGEEQGGVEALTPPGPAASRDLPTLVHDQRAVLGFIALPFLSQRSRVAEGLGA